MSASAALHKKNCPVLKPKGVFINQNINESWTMIKEDGYIDVGDGYQRRNQLMTTLGYW